MEKNQSQGNMSLGASSILHILFVFVLFFVTALLVFVLVQNTSATKKQEQKAEVFEEELAERARSNNENEEKELSRGTLDRQRQAFKLKEGVLMRLEERLKAGEELLAQKRANGEEAEQQEQALGRFKDRLDAAREQLDEERKSLFVEEPA